MKIEIEIYYYSEQHIFKNLIDDLKNKQANIIKEDMFTISLELNVNSFDEIIILLTKYSRLIDISLYIHTSDNIVVFISSKKTCSLGNQVD